MNQRIQALWKQCKTPNWCYFNQTYDHEKFAQLIVQDCIDIIAPYTVRMSRPGEEYLHPIQEIKKNFGVK